MNCRESFWKQRDDNLKKIFILFLSLAFSLFTGCGYLQGAGKSFAYPVTEFENREVRIEMGGFEASGKISCTKEQMITLLFSQPPAIEGMKITRNASEEKTEFLDITHSGNLLEKNGISEIFEAITLMADSANLTKDEAGYYGFTSSGKGFTVITDENGAICQITFKGITAKFEAFEEEKSGD